MGRVILRKEKVLKRKVKKESICPRQDRKRARERERERERGWLVGNVLLSSSCTTSIHSSPPPHFVSFVFPLFIHCI